MPYVNEIVQNSDFELVRQALRARVTSQRRQAFLVPEFLCDNGNVTTRLIDVGDPYKFLADIFDRIVSDQNPARQRRGIDRADRVYQSFPRTFASLNGRIGTALTQIAFLPFLRNVLGITVFVCLPTGRMGSTNRKGERGSPFAVRDPFDIDPSLADPLIAEIPASAQYRALVQACRLLGIRAGSVVPMSTLAIDSPMFAAVPELGFWWRAEPGELVHCARDNNEALSHAGSSAPNIDGRTASRFVPAPPAAAVTTTQHTTGDYHVVHGTPHDSATVTLANAFPDVLAGDATTYTWSDVATVRYTRSETPTPAGVRDETAHDPGRPAWILMPALLAWRYHELGERVFLIDVSPSVPTQLLTRARELAGAWRQDIAERLVALGAGRLATRETELLLRDIQTAIAGAECTVTDMTFIGEELWDFDSPNTELDAVCGPLIYCISAHTHNIPILVDSMAHHLRILEQRSGKGSYFAGVGNHDTMPALPWASALLQVIYTFLPGAVPLIFSGTEWGSQVVTNKEFGFDTTAQLLRVRDELDDQFLGLFNDAPLDWHTLENSGAQIEFAVGLLDVVRLFDDLESWWYTSLFPDPNSAPSCFGYFRTTPAEPNRRLVVLANWAAEPTTIRWPTPAARPILTVPLGWWPTVIGAGELVTFPARSAIVALTDLSDE